MPVPAAFGSGRCHLWRPALLSFSALTLAIPTSAQQDVGFRLPVELTQGAVFGAGPLTPYQAGVAIIPGWSFEPIRVGLKLALDYDNPSWRGRLGLRLSKRVYRIVRNDVGLMLAGEGSTTIEGDARVGGGLIFDADGLIRMGLWGGWEAIHDGAWFGVTFGADPTSWFGCVPDDFGGGCNGGGDQ
jgi:hypothetical protein